MATPTNGANPFVFADQAYDIWEKHMGTWWDEVLESQPFLSAMNQGLTSQVRMRKEYEGAVDKQLDKLHLPTKADLVRVARVSTLLEEKVLTLEDTLLKMGALLTAQSAAMQRLEREAVQARIEATEARIELRERLGELVSRLEALEAKANGAARKTKVGGEG